MSFSKPQRPASSTHSANQDIANFLMSANKRPIRQDSGRNRGGQPPLRQDSGFTRDSNDYSERAQTREKPYGAAPAGGSDFGDLGIPTQDRSYGARKRNPIDPADKNDRIIQIERENNTLKEKENFLRQEILMMQTKLRRVESLIKSRSRATDNLGDGDYDVTDMQRDLKTECEELKEQNESIREKVRKLNVVSRGLTQQMTTGPLHKSGIAKNEKYAHVQGKLDSSHSKVTTRYQIEARDVKAQININNRKLIELEAQLQEAVASHGGSGNQGVDSLRQEILDMQRECREIESQMEMLQGDFAQNKTIFEESKNYVSELHENLRKVNEQNEILRQENFRLQLQTQEVADLEKELEDTIEARDNIERCIRNVTAEPFLRKGEQGNSVAIRVQDLTLRLQEKERLARKLKEEEAQILEIFQEQKHAMDTLGRDKRDLEKKHNEVKKNFQDNFENNRGPNEQDAFNGLLKMDPSKYATTMVDLAMGAPQGGGPIWANLPFLEPTVERHDADPKKAIKNEIDRLRQEKSDFAAELEKAQNLLKLQTDIERENTVYFMHEENRLKLIEKSVSAKVEELSRRADDKARTVAEIDRKISMDLRQSGLKDGGPLRASLQTDLDTRSEFSAQTQESEVALDENILDFKIEDAEYDANAISAIPSVSMTGSEIDRQFITVVTVDFYNHSTETTQMSEGLRANYQTQFSFVNKVDNFYVSFLQKNSLKMDVYVSKNNAAVQVGRAEILLKELIESEVISHNVNAKTPVIQRWARVFPVSFPVNQSGGVLNQQMKPVGVIKYKMRLRKPIQQAMRYFREQNEIKNVEKFVSMDPKLGSIKPQKKLVTISIVAAHELKTSYSSTVNMSPFFFYQFYTFDDRYSANSVGVNPNFNDTYSYEVLVDAKAIQYFESQNLDVILFDDNAPISGVGLDQSQNPSNDDMIGMCRIPLASLASGCSMHEKLPIKALDSMTQVGQLEVRIDIVDLEQTNNEGLFMKHSHDLVFTKEFEQEIIMQIARKLAPLNCEIELMFGIFSQGQRNCTKEDFKHTCLNRLRLLRDGLQERELDIFLRSNDYMRDSNVIEKDDFVHVFAGAIAAARNERLNQISIDQTLARDTMTRGQTMSKDRTVNMMSVQENIIYEILANAILTGAQYKIMGEATSRSTLYRIRSAQLKSIFTAQGIHEQDAFKVIKYLEVDEMVDLNRLDEAMNRAKQTAIRESSAIVSLHRAIQSNGKVVIESMERQDYNKDGLLNIDGFEASLLIREVGMSNSDLKEVFYLICGSDQLLPYQTWILTKFPQFKAYFSFNVTPRETTRVEESGTMISHSQIDHSSTLLQDSITDRMENANNQQKYQIARQKIEKYILSQDINLGIMFAVMDTNSDNQIGFPEFRNKMRGMHVPLEDDECQAFFRHLDINGSNSIDFDEFVNEFASISTEKVIKGIKKILVQGKIDPEFFFNKHCKMDRSNQKLSLNEFSNLLKEVLPRLIKREVYHVQKYFDRGNKGQITKTDFLHVISSDFIEQKTFSLSIEDVIKPLATKCRRFNLNLSVQFDKYDLNRNNSLSAEELRAALAKNQISMTDDDVMIIKEYFLNKTRSDSITKQDFIALMNTQFDRKFDQQVARKSLSDIKMKAEELKLDNAKLQEAIQHFNEDKAELINIVNFKRAINNLKCLDQFAIDNLAKFCDTNNEGYISVSSLIAQINNAVMSSSFRSTLTNKWAR